MTNYVLLYLSGRMAETEAAQAAEMEVWGSWFGTLGSSLVDGGSPFTQTVKSVESDGSVIVGPIGKAATGYSIVKAESLDEAVKMAGGCPILQSGGQVSVYEVLPM